MENDPHNSVALRVKAKGSRNVRNAMRLPRALLKRGFITDSSIAEEYAGALLRFAHWLDANGFCLKSLTEVKPDLARLFLVFRRNSGASQLELITERKALVASLAFLRRQDIYGSSVSSRVLCPYSDEQIGAVLRSMMPIHQLPFELCLAAGFRISELRTLRAIDVRIPNTPNDNLAFVGMENYRRYTVISFEGLLREVRIPIVLANRLERLRMSPLFRKSGDATYEIHYQICSARELAVDFDCASLRVLGFSAGIRCLRFRFIERRWAILLPRARDIAHAKAIVRMEAGLTDSDKILTHLRPGYPGA